MKVAYVAGPYRADTIYGVAQNIQKARDVALRLWKLGYAAICPHSNTAFFDGACDDSVWLSGDLEILRRCDFVVVLDGWEKSEGATKEVQIANIDGIPVYPESWVEEQEGGGRPVSYADEQLEYLRTRGQADAVVKGVGADAPVVANKFGGKQSKMEYDFTQLDPLAMFQLAGILKRGADKYGRDNWKRITTEEHLNHALQHIFAYLAGDRQDDHLGHAFCRLMMAIVVGRDGLAL